MPQPQPTQPSGTSGLVWVQGEAGAKSYLMTPNQTALLMDSENQVFYLKSTDNAGMPLPLRIFDYSERTQKLAEPPMTAIPDMDSKYVLRAEYDEMVSKYAELEEAVKTRPARTRKESENNA